MPNAIQEAVEVQRAVRSRLEFKEPVEKVHDKFLEWAERSVGFEPTLTIGIEHHNIEKQDSIDITLPKRNVRSL